MTKNLSKLDLHGTYPKNEKTVKVLYTRVSTVEQNTDRQKVGSADYDLIVEDKCSGTIPFSEREGGKRISELIDKGCNLEISVWSIDRLGRDVRDILNTIYYFNSKKISIHFLSQGLRTLNDDYSENPIAKMIISILGIVSEMERNAIKERTTEGIAIAKLKGKFLGRVKGSTEDTLSFLSKPKNKKAVELLKKGYTITEVSKIVSLSYNSVSKISKLIVINA
jgi:DNA invertase Pin-like site-specific DNA recombinase